MYYSDFKLEDEFKAESDSAAFVHALSVYAGCKQSSPMLKSFTVEDSEGKHIPMQFLDEDAWSMVFAIGGISDDAMKENFKRNIYFHYK